LLGQLEQSQWWAPPTLRAWQLRQASVLVDHALRTVPFHGPRLRDAGLAPGQALAPEDFARIPVMTRADIQAAGADLHTTALPKGHGPLSKVSSSGSTGRPIDTLGTSLSRLYWDVFTLRDHLWHDRDLRGTLASIRSFPTGRATYPRGARGKTWGGATAAVYPTGPAFALSVLSTTEQQAEWLIRHNPDYLLTFPSALGALARHCRAAGLTPPRLRAARTISEILTPEVRAACREAWGVPVVDIYSANETGYMALQCPTHEHYHVQCEGVLLEILDDEGAPCAPGQVGRVVVTALHNFAMPLVRYEIGDLAEAGPPCPCGRGLPVIARILGRVRNMVRLPGGAQAWPLIGEPSYAAIPALRQYQMVQKTLHRLELRLVAQRPLTAAEEARLRRIILERIGHPFEIDITYHDHIARGPGGKYEDFKCELEAP